MIKAKWSRKVKANRKDNLMKYAGSICGYVKKAENIGRIMLRNVVTSEKARLLSVCACLRKYETSSLPFYLILNI